MAHIGQKGTLRHIGRLGGFLGVQQGGFLFLAARDISDEGHDAVTGALACRQEIGRDFHRDHAAILAPLHVLNRIFAEATHPLGQDAVIRHTHVVVEIDYPHGTHFFHRVTQHRGGGVIDVEQFCRFEIGPMDSDADAIHGELRFLQIQVRAFKRGGALFDQLLQTMSVQREFIGHGTQFGDVPRDT